MYNYMLHALENFSFYDGRDVYVMKKKNNHYVYHNAAMITIPTRCPATALENASPIRKRAQEV